MSIRKINAILKKQVKDTFKNKAVFIQFIMFPLLAFVMENVMSLADIPKNYFVTLFSTMYIGMAPLISVASIIAEEKETTTLRMLIMSNVKAIEYLLGVGIYVFFLCMLGIISFALMGGFSGSLFWEFLIIMAIGVIISTLLGGVIGVWSKNHMAATSIAVPVMMVFAFLPMISMFNEKIRLVARITYSQQINELTNSLGSGSVSLEHVGVISLNLIMMVGLFIVVYKRNSIDY